MLTQVEIEGFKSFGSPAQRIYVGPLNFIVGPNASGKSNFLAALQFLQTAVRYDVETASAALGGSSVIYNKRLLNGDSEPHIRIRLRDDTSADLSAIGLENHQITSYDYELTLDAPYLEGYPTVREERLNAQIKDSENTIHTYNLIRSGNKVTTRNPVTLSGLSPEANEIETPALEPARLTVNTSYDLPALLMRTRVQGWCFYNISPAVARQAHPEIPGVSLGHSGEGLAVMLNRLKHRNGGKALVAVEKALQSLVPDFHGVNPIRLEVEGTWVFRVEEKDIKEGINPASVSDGTVRLLALLVIAAEAGDDRPLMAIEEPENGLHPHLIPEIVDLLRGCSASGTQVFATTHNPSFLDAVEPAEAVLCDKVGGFTTMVSAATLPDVESFRRSFSLGELWEQGALGGVP